MDFLSLDYLKQGNKRQQKAHQILTDYQVFEKLAHFDPILAGTIPIQIDIADSDLDIICCFADAAYFCESVIAAFGHHENFVIQEVSNESSPAIVANFELAGFAMEIFGQAIPTKQQFAYRHLMVEYQLLQKYGEVFRQRIISLKKQGYKTEPAFATALGLSGDPYLALLAFE